MDVTLSSLQFTALQDALVGTFPGYDLLRELTRRQLSLPLQRVSANGPLPAVVLNLLEWAEANGRIDDLIAGAINEAPRSPWLRALGVEIALTSSTAPSHHLETLVLPGSRPVDAAPWRSEMANREILICRIEMPAGQAAGTGFLVGPDLVLTNRHVADELAKRGAGAAQCAARFAYQIGAGGEASVGEAIAFAEDWEAASSPIAELDAAIIRLCRPTGRGWLPPPQPYAFQNGEVQLILHHPMGEHLKLSAGVVATDPAGGESRVSYTVNTEPGSSGSPVFTLDWRHVALHHRGGARSNMGIPLWLIGQEPDFAALWRGA
jgi:hypothetical protein